LAFPLVFPKKRWLENRDPENRMWHSGIAQFQNTKWDGKMAVYGLLDAFGLPKVYLVYLNTLL
jgi:hypothetical protein